MKKYLITIKAIFLILIPGITETMAQKDTTRLKQEVEVTKAYQPTVSEAVKINDVPSVKPEQTEPPVFNYSIFSKPVFSTFSPTPVPAAKMVGNQSVDSNIGLLRLGAGNYLTPYGELFINSKPDKNSNFGMHFKHLSSNGKLKLINNDKVKAHESENFASVFGKKYYRNSTLSGSLSFDRNAFNYYGYHGEILTDEQKEMIIPAFDDKQYFSKGIADIGIKSEIISQYLFNYDFGIKMQYLKSKTGQTESNALFKANMNKKFGDILGTINSSAVYISTDSIWNNTSNKFGSKQQIFININPSIGLTSDIAGIRAGLNSTMFFDDDADAKLLIWPNVKANWSAIPEYLTIFASADGFLKQNSYSEITAENKYVDPFHDIKSSNNKLVLSGGLKGKFTRKTNFLAEASYSMIDDQHFYITTTSNYFVNLTSNLRKYNNTFSWMYDDVNALKLTGELLHSVSEKFSLHLKGNYYSYKTENIEKAWNMPNYDFTVSTVFNPEGPLKFTADIFLIGERTALISDYNLSLSSLSGNTLHKVELDRIIDLNAGIDYKFSEKLSFFGKLNNFGFQKYEQWLGYTSKGVNGLIGLSYSF